MLWPFIQAMSFFTSAITSGPMPSPASRRSLWVAIERLVTQHSLRHSGRAEREPGILIPSIHNRAELGLWIRTAALRWLPE